MPLISLSNKQYQIPHVSGEDIKLGGEKTTFEPRLDMSAFLGESKLSFLPQTLTVAETAKGDILEAENSSLKLLWKATPVISGFNERGGLDIIITLLTKPDKPYIDFGYDVTRLIPYHQPELTQAEITEGAVRPEHIINSIAWYHNTKGGLVTPSDARKFITTGKAFHTYRMIANDVQGNKTWTDWTVEKSGIIRLNIDSTWLEKAKYPVIIQPVGDTFGYTTAGASSQGVNGNDLYGQQGTPAISGTIDNIKASVSSHFGSRFKPVMVVTSTLTIITNGVGDAYTGTTDDKEWITLLYTTAPSIVGGTNYKVCWIEDGTGCSMYYDTGGVDPQRFIDTSNSYATPQDVGTGGTTSGSKYSIYCTYTPSGGAIELSVTDGFKIGDSRSESMTASPSVIDGFKSGDSLAGLGNMAVALSDGLKVGDTTLVQAVLSLIDGLIAGDSASESMTANSSLTDGLKLGDITLIELVSGGIYYLSVTEGLKIGDSSLISMLANLQLSDGTKLGDSYLAGMTANLQLSEGIEVGDATVSQLLASLQLSDGVKLGDTPLAAMLAGIQLSDGIKLGDLPICILVSAIELSVTDGFKLGDNTSIAFLVAIKLALYLRSRGFTLSPRTRSLTLSPRSESLSLESRNATLTLARRNRNLTLPERK